MGIGWSEMFIIGVIALMVLGEDKFPDFVKVAIRAFRDFRGYWDEIKGEVQREVSKPLERELQPLRRELQQLSRMDPETYINKLTSTTANPPKIDGAVASDDAGSTPPPSEPTPTREPDEPAGSMNSEDEKIMAAGTTPYVGGGLGARAAAAEAPAENAVVEPAGEAARSAQAQTPSKESELSEHDQVTPPTRID